jgi:hypothetical protein
MRLFWTRWRAVLFRILTVASSMTGLLVIGLPQVAFAELPSWGITVIVFSIVMFIVFVILEIGTVRAHKVFKLTNERGIREYMHDWIKPGGRVAIWTRDMSWAENADTKRLLCEKADARELIICLPDRLPLTEELEQRGAEVVAYGNFTPASRFTITFFERDGSRVAVGRAVGDTHVIDEFKASETPAFYLAQDLVRLARVAAEAR